MTHKLETSEKNCIEFAKDNGKVFIMITNDKERAGIALDSEDLYEVIGVLHHLQKQSK